jgi:hypothetical protein
MDQLRVRTLTGISLAILLLISTTYVLARDIQCPDITAGVWARADLAGRALARKQWKTCVAHTIHRTFDWKNAELPTNDCEKVTAFRKSSYVRNLAKYSVHAECEYESNANDRPNYCYAQGVVCYDADAR